MTDHEEDSRPGQESSRPQPTEAGPTPAPKAEPREPCADRTRIHLTNIRPYILIGQLIVTFRSTSRFEPVTYCTGILLGERHVLTAAHNLYNPRLGVWAYSIGFQAARDGALVHYPSIAGLYEPSRAIPAAVKESVVKYYAGELADLKAPPYDYCVLELSNSLAPTAEWLDLGAPTPEELAAVTDPGSGQINITGYPGEQYADRTAYPDSLQLPDIPFGTMWGQRGSLSDYSDSLLFYDICATGGQSGAPILMNLSGDPHDWLIVGLHLFSGRPRSVGLRFTDEIVRDIQKQTPKVKIKSAPAAPSRKVKGEESMNDRRRTIKWTDAGGGLEVVTAVSEGGAFTVVVTEAGQNSAWDKALGAPHPASGGGAESAGVGNGGRRVTIEVVREALQYIPIIALAGIMAYAISRGYRVTGSSTGSGWNFEFGPPQ